MEKGSLGFLELLYRGQFVRELCTPNLNTIDEEKVADLVQRFREAAHRFDTRKIEEGHRLPGPLLEAMKELGIFGLIIPKEYGGLGFTISEYLRFIEQMAGMDMALSLVPLAHLSIGLKGLLLFGNDEQKRRYLPPAATGEMIFAYALTEPTVGSDAQHILTRAEKTPDGSAYLITGTKTYITNANYARAFTVFAQLDPENPGTIGAFVVEREWEGVSVGKDMPKMGLHVSSTAPVMLKEVRVPAANLIGEPGEGFKIAMSILNYGRLGLGASSAGLMHQSVKEMTDRASKRRQFGVPILDFELIQEKIVEARAHAFAASAITYFTAAMLDRDPLANVAIESSHTKLYGTTRCWDTLYEALQTAGGSGYLATLPYEKRMRDFRVTTIFEGTTEIHSIYPPLSLFRHYGKILRNKGMLGKWLTLRRLASTTTLAQMDGGPPALSRARTAAMRSERLFRSLLRTGLMRFGSRIVSEELFLRRMTRLSLSLFWLVSSTAYIRARANGGNLPEEELDILDYLAAEAEELQRSEGRTGPSRRESLHSRIIASLVAHREG